MLVITAPTACIVATLASEVAVLEVARKISDETFNHSEHDRLNDALSSIREAATHQIPRSLDGVQFLLGLIPLYTEFAQDDDADGRDKNLKTIDRISRSVSQFTMATA